MPRRKANRALQRTLRLFLAVVLLMTACRQHKDSADEKMQKQHPGTWFFEAKYAQGNEEETLAVAPDGSYTLAVYMPGQTNEGHVRAVNLEGTLRVEDGFLIDTVTKSTSGVAITNRARIIRINDRELAIEYERLPGVVYATNQTVFLKQIK